MSPASKKFSNNPNNFGLSFAGRMMKLETAADAEDIAREIENCRDLRYLNLDGNSIGIGAAKRIGEALKGHGEFSRAKWNNMFTSRSKEEIPVALNCLFDGIIEASAELIELDLSDNAFGPIGVRSLAGFLASKACFKLQELRLNNNGLGPEGARLLAKALDQCYINSGRKLALHVFIAGRNRLENDGIHSLSEVFQKLGTLEEVSIPQNGIYHKGISDLCSALRRNKSIKILNVNDNTVRKEGAGCLSRVIPVLSSLEVLNLGDCLLGNDGAMLIAKSLKHINSLKELNFEHNEISLKVGTLIMRAVSCMPNLKHVNINGNTFGEVGIRKIKSESKTLGIVDALGGFSEDEGTASGSEDEDQLLEENSKDTCKTNIEQNHAHNEVSSKELHPPQSSQVLNTGRKSNGNVIVCSDDEDVAIGENEATVSGSQLSALQETVKIFPQPASRIVTESALQTGRQQTSQDDAVQTSSTSQQSVASTTQESTGSTTISSECTPGSDAATTDTSIDPCTITANRNHNSIMRFIHEVNDKYEIYKRFLGTMAILSDYCFSRGESEHRVGLDQAILMFQRYFSFAAQYDETVKAANYVLAKVGLLKNEVGYQPDPLMKKNGISMLQFICSREDVLPPNVRRIIKHVLEFPPKC